MAETKKNQIVIDDISPKVFQKLLEFIYTDDLKIDPDIGNIILELLDASVKYQLERLQNLSKKASQLIMC